MNASGDSKTKRLFWAAELEPVVLQAAVDLTEALRVIARENNWRVAWTRPEKLHITLRFLGPTPEDKIDSVLRTVKEVGARTSPFSIVVKGTGIFSSRGRPTVIWAGVQDSDQPGALSSLVCSMNNSLTAIGFPRETRSFSGHLTLGRVKNAGRGALQDLIQFEEIVLGTSLVREVVCFESILGPGEAEYRVIDRVQFGVERPGEKR